MRISGYVRAEIKDNGNVYARQYGEHSHDSYAEEQTALRAHTVPAASSILRILNLPVYAFCLDESIFNH